jgi:hypothetical protein
MPVGNREHVDVQDAIAACIDESTVQKCQNCPALPELPGTARTARHCQTCFAAA